MTNARKPIYNVYRARKLDEDRKKKKANQVEKGLKGYLLNTFFYCNQKVQHSYMGWINRYI